MLLLCSHPPKSPPSLRGESKFLPVATRLSGLPLHLLHTVHTHGAPERAPFPPQDSDPRPGVRIHDATRSSWDIMSVREVLFN